MMYDQLPIWNVGIMDLAIAEVGAMIETQAPCGDPECPVHDMDETEQSFRTIAATSVLELMIEARVSMIVQNHSILESDLDAEQALSYMLEIQDYRQAIAEMIPAKSTVIEQYKNQEQSDD